jgi:DNA-directed RNA polymerase subunit RPC12/RpoP
VIEFKCTQCGQPLEADYQAAGKKASCIKCGTAVEIPQPEFLPRMQCPHCKSELDFRPSSAGMVEKCPQCGGMVHVPGGKDALSGCLGLSLVCALVAAGLAWLTTGLLP